MDVMTFGCRLNHAESYEIENICTTLGLHDVIVVNSCAVTSEAERQLNQTLRRLRRQQPKKRIVLTGCASTINPKRYQNGLVDYIIHNDKKTNYNSFAMLESSNVNNKDTVAADMLSPPIFNKTEPNNQPAGGAPKGHVRAYLQVQQGCDHACTFCIIPQGRGKSVSFDVDTIIKKAHGLVEKGFHEIILTGVDLTSWKNPYLGQKNKDLGFLVEKILKEVPQLKRLRLSSIDCIEIDPLLLDIMMHEERLMPHLHFSLQSGDDLILKRMKRRHSCQDFIKLCQQLKQARPEFTFGADFITGFPTETDEMFRNTLTLAQECDLLWLHVFPYSPRQGTPSARIPDQIAVSLRKQRAKLLREQAQNRLSDHLMRQIGKEMTILMESEQMGRAPDNSLVMLRDSTKFYQAGTFVDVRITKLYQEKKDQDNQSSFLIEGSLI